MANASILAAFERMWQHVVAKVDGVKTYADTAAANVKNDLLNGAGGAYDTLKELGDLIDDNQEAIEALETIASSKQPTITGGATTITSSNLTTNRALISNGSGKVAVSAVTSTELGYLDGVTSSVQTQLNTISSTATAAKNTADAAVPSSRTVNGKALSSNISLSASDVGALPNTTSIPDALSDLASDSTHRTVTDAEKAAWNAKSNFSGSYNDLTNKPTIPSISGLASETYVDDAIDDITASDVGAVPTSRTVNGKALSSNITLSASDVGARASTWTPSASDVGAVPTSRTVNSKALSSNITLSASDVGAVPTTRTVNGKALSSNITLSASDVGARSSTWVPSASDISSGTLAVSRGGTGLGSVTANNFLVGNGTSAMVQKTPAQVRSILGLTEGTLTVPYGGTGKTSFTANRFLVGNGTNAIAEKTADEALALLGYRPMRADSTYTGCYYYPDSNNVKWWVNPPMVAGTEYRTVEAYKGKPVYWKLCNLGTMPNSSYKNYENLATNVKELVSADLSFSGSSNAAHINPAELTMCHVGSYSTPYCEITTNGNFSSYTGYLLLKYIKTTD